MIIESLLMVALVIALVWMILYCFYLKQRIRDGLRDAENRIRKVDGELCNTRMLLRKLGLLLGYELHESAEFIKKDI